MNGSSNNDNEVIVLTQDITYPPVTPSKQQPLSNNNSPTPSFKSPKRNNTLSPLRKKQQQQQQPKPAALSSSSSSSSSREHISRSNTSSNSALSQSHQVSEEEFKSLQRSFADSLLNFNNLENENQRLQHDLTIKTTQLENQLERIHYLEQSIKEAEMDNLHNQDILNKQVEMYKEMIDKLQTKIVELNDELERKPPLETIDASLFKKYEKLVRDYKILDSQFEVERNSKLVLIDQIEFLSRKNEDLIKQIGAPIEESDNESDANVDYLADLTDNVTHTMNELTDDEHEQEQKASVISPGLNIYHGIAYQSSPIKSYDDSNSSVKVSPNFQFPPPPPPPPTSHLPCLSEQQQRQQQQQSSTFPPSPEPECKDKKRSSLPTHLKQKHTGEEDDDEGIDFVLSPFKLTPSQALYANDDSSVFPDDNGNAGVIKRYSATKPTHSRYNSHDLVPIKVEFEKLESGIRSTSVPEKSLKESSTCETIDENTGNGNIKMSKYRNGTLFALNGYTHNNNNNDDDDEGDNDYDDRPTNISKNFSEMDISSKRSSYLNSDEKTKQEIMKLKFELRSLKLHNEKLLSFIGFELQKQRNNLKKLSRKQSARLLAGSKNIEYSDAKLIEKSRDLLINKKRVLRSVSINTGFKDRFPIKNIGIIAPNSEPAYVNHYDEDDFIDDSHDFLDMNSLSHNDKMIKKFASQVFSNTKALYEYDSDSDFENTSHWVLEEGEEGNEHDDEDNLTPNTSGSSSEEEQIGVFRQIKHMVIGGEAVNKSKKKRSKKDDQHLVDDGLKFKFLTIALGIVIIGLKLTPHNNQNITR
ncbi:uncharacterized protein Sgm1 homologue, putative [Candida dubliniensis CD36]|uniref:Uncharacterized protein Sgm1 homologue, putative n=1 Tax=Candida dubliniensis (strain CD36 / ATCC MYA-646 / CBS 7987 / NCPF 3949 / NRRL Y-17841) TaxID=573826 RepID=B9WGY5_CANDC|nr:uncharacterized protein Sgm1 homologue, putative [Candida dubliniensis CD36]CAX41423.1 uncharacterized protein Sgm1 homologue, putative [Candida dubliniensis CD36]